MTKDEAIKTLREDYCGNRIICELHPDQCNQEECEIWCAIKALETQPDGDAISRRDAIRIVDSIDTWQAGWRGDAIESLKALPSSQPDLSSYSDKLWRNAYERGKTEAQAEIVRCGECKHMTTEGRCLEFADDDLRPSASDFCSYAERREDE